MYGDCSTVPPIFTVAAPSPRDLVPSVGQSTSNIAKAAAEQDDLLIGDGGGGSCFYFGGRHCRWPGNLRSANMAARLQSCLDVGRARN